MADTTITLDEEVSRWHTELEGMALTGHRVAKAKLKEFDNIPFSDKAGLQNWVGSLFWLSRRNEQMAEVNAKVNKKKDEPEIEAAKPEPKPEPRRKTFKSLTELLGHYEGIKAIRLDGKVNSSSLEVFAVADNSNPDAYPELWLRIGTPKDPATGGTIPSGEYRILDVGIVTLCRRLGMSYKYFTSKYPRRQEIVEHMNVMNKSIEKDYVLRLLKEGDTYVVQAVLPKAFVPIDHADVLRAIVQSCTESGLDVPVLDAFVEGPFDRAVDVIDIRLPGTATPGFKPLLRIVNSEVDFSPLLFAMGALAGKSATYVSMARAHGAVRVTHRGKAGDIKDWLKVPELIEKAKPVAEAVTAIADKPLHKPRTTEFLVHKLGVVGTDVEAFLTDYFVAHPGPDTLGIYVQGLVETSKAFPVSKMQKMCDLSLALVYGDIPTVN